MGSVVNRFEDGGNRRAIGTGIIIHGAGGRCSWLCVACRSEVRCQSSRCRAPSRKPKSLGGPWATSVSSWESSAACARSFPRTRRARQSVLGRQHLRNGGGQSGRPGTYSASRRRRSVFECGSGVFTSSRPRSSQFLGLRLPHRALAPFVPNLDRNSMRLIPGRTHSLRLLVDYLGLLGSSQVPRSTELDRAISIHILDLIALSVGARQDAATEAQDRGVRAARLQAIKADVASRFSEEELSVATVAARHSVTLRYIHKLFETEGATFSEYVLASRLEFAHRMLTDRRFVGRSITSIAFDAGFSELFSFNRMFRRRYNTTPTEIPAARTFLTHAFLRFSRLDLRRTYPCIAPSDALGQRATPNNWQKGQYRPRPVPYRGEKSGLEPGCDRESRACRH